MSLFYNFLGNIFSLTFSITQCQFYIGIRKISMQRAVSIFTVLVIIVMFKGFNYIGSEYCLVMFYSHLVFEMTVKVRKKKNPFLNGPFQ